MSRNGRARRAWLSGGLLAAGLVAGMAGGLAAGWSANLALAQAGGGSGPPAMSGHEMMAPGLGAPHEHETLPPAERGTLPSESVYQLESTWTDQDSVRVPIGALKGKPQVVAMFYTNCQYVCPLIVDEMKKVDREMSEPLRQQFGFALFSFDSERDSAAVLKAYVGKRDLDGRRWRLYTGTPDEVLELAAVLGVRYRKEPSGEFSHSAIITVLDRNGVIVYQMLGLNQDRAPLVKALRAALEG